MNQENTIQCSWRFDEREDEFLLLIVHKGIDAISFLLFEGLIDIDQLDSDSFDYCMLHIAACEGKEDVVEWLLEHGADINLKNSYKDTALSLAVVEGHEKIVEILLAKGADCYYRSDDEQFTLLHYAALRHGHTNILKSLLDHGMGMNVNETDDDGQTCLHLACSRGREEIVKMLLDYGADINIKDKRETSVLHCAADRGNENIFKLLLELGMDINDRTIFNNSVLSVACINGREKIVRILLDHGVDIPIDFEDRRGWTLVHCAARGGNENIFKLILTGISTLSNGESAVQPGMIRSYGEIVKILLEREAKESAQQKNNMLLHCAVYGGNEYIVRLLLENGAKMNAEQEFCETALYIAVVERNENIVTLLLRHEANPINLEKFRFLSLACALRCHNENMIKVLMDNGADINAYNGGKTILVTALERYQEITRVRLSLNYGADVNSTKSILFRAIKSWRNSSLTSDDFLGNLKGSSSAVMELLLDYGANVQNKLGSGCTILSFAVHQEDESSLQLLLDYQADINIEDHEERSAVHQALNRGYNKCAKILTRHIVKIQSAGLHVTEKILRVIDSSKKLRVFRIQCEEEIEKMKYAEGEISFWRILISTMSSSTNLARNKHVIEVLGSEEFKRKFPIYSSVMKNQIRRGIWRNVLLDKVKFFFGAVAKAEGNEHLPELPGLCVDKIFTYFNNKDFRNLIKVCDPFNKFALDLCDINI